MKDDDDDDDKGECVEEEEEEQQQQHAEFHRQGTTTLSGMESSVFSFQSVNFTVGKKDKKKQILQDVSGRVKWGHVLAILGPSGAGKTTLISSLTLDALYGKAYGQVKLNGVPLTDDIFKAHCTVVKQHDKHWSYLTLRETLHYAAQLYAIQNSKQQVDTIIEKMGLSTCADTRNGSLSGGQQRRLSIGVALLKQPTLLFLDEPTSGLDAAAAQNIMQEIIRIAKQERVIIVCTIHQPSTKVYNGFDELMILSRGRQAFAGNVNDAMPYFESIGCPCPPNTNPAEYFLDLVNSDFSDESAVTRLLNVWEEKRGALVQSRRGKKEGFDDEQDGVTKRVSLPLSKELVVMMRRHARMIVRDPILYIGRCGAILVMNLVFAIVYFSARNNTQDQALNKMWLHAWFMGVPSNLAVVAVYALNDEFKSVMRETKNGMVRGVSYVIAKSVLVLPILFLFGIFGLGIPLFAIHSEPGDSFVILIVLFACLMFVFESLAECLAVWFTDPILGMLNVRLVFVLGKYISLASHQLLNFWFASFLFSGLLLPEEDLYWPFTLFYYIMPFRYYLKSFEYQVFKQTTFEACVDPTVSSVCVNATDGLLVLEDFSRTIPFLSIENQIASDVGILILIGVFYKALYIGGVIYKTTRASKFHSNLEN